MVVFTFLASWNEFLAALIFLREQDKFTMPILLNSVIFLLLQRYYISGLTQGAIKG